MDDVWEVRLLVEPVAVRKVAAAPTPEGMRELRELAANAAEVVADKMASVVANLAFVDALVRQSGSHTLRAVCALLHDVIEATALASAAGVGLPRA